MFVRKTGNTVKSGHDWLRDITFSPVIQIHTGPDIYFRVKSFLFTNVYSPCVHRLKPTQLYYHTVGTNSISIIERVCEPHGKFTYNDVMRLVIILAVWWKSCVTGCPNMFQVIEYGVGKMTYHVIYIVGNSTKCPP